MSVCNESGEEVVVEEEFESEDDGDYYLFQRRDQSVPKAQAQPLPDSPLSKKHENENAEKNKLKKKIGGSNSRCGKENRVIQQVWSHRTGIQLLKCAVEWGKIYYMNQFRDFVNQSLKPK